MALTRLDVENEIERLIGLLDTLDGDCDLEANGDLEPDASDENVNRLTLNPPPIPTKRIRRAA